MSQFYVYLSFMQFIAFTQLANQLDIAGLFLVIN